MNYLTAEEIIKINTLLIKRFSPKEQMGVKEPSALNMIVNQPKQVVFGKDLYASVFDKAAILLINLIQKHAFYNANKRTGFVAAVLFLTKNGYELDLSTEQAVDLAVSISVSTEDFDILKKSVVKYLKQHSTKKV